MSTTTMVHVRLDEQLKTRAAETLASMGLSVSDAIRVFLTRVVAEQAIPFYIRVPNAATRAAMAEADDVVARQSARFTSAAALFDDLEKNVGQ